MILFLCIEYPAQRSIRCGSKYFTFLPVTLLTPGRRYGDISHSLTLRQ